MLITEGVRRERGTLLGMEKKFAMAIAALVSMEPKTAGAIFHEIAEQYPQFIQARLISLFLTRGGYDVANEPSRMRKLAIEKTHELMKKYPENPMIMGFWLVLNAEVPSQRHGYQERDSSTCPFTW